jgi:ribosomal protein S8E
MANQSSTGFGLRAIRKVAQNDSNQGLTEYNIAASSTAIYHDDAVKSAATGDIVVAAATDTSIGVLNGVFYTDATTSKPTFQNYLQGSNTASDIVGFIHDDPYQMFEIRSNNSSASAATDVFNNADISYSAGATPNFVSRTTLDDSTLTAGGTGSAQLRVLGVSRDPSNSDLTAANVVWRVQINEHFLKATASI